MAHLSQAQPDRTFGRKQNAFVYRIPGENQDIGTQMAFAMPDDDDDDDDNVYKRTIMSPILILIVYLTSSTWTSYGVLQTEYRKS